MTTLSRTPPTAKFERSPMIYPTSAASTDFHIKDHEQCDRVSDALAAWPPAGNLAHHDLFEALDALSQCDDSTFRAQYVRLVEKVERSFREEEAWMDSIDFPALLPHLEQHARVLGALHNVHSRLMDNDLGLARHVVAELLPQWLLLHGATVDAPLTPAMQLAPPHQEMSAHIM